MQNEDKTQSDAWESGKLGQSEEHVQRTDEKTQAALDEATGLQLISLRLPKVMINDLKIIAKLNGIGYQPLIRQLLTKFVVAEKKMALLDALETTRNQEKIAKSDAAKASKRQIKERKAA